MFFLKPHACPHCQESQGALRRLHHLREGEHAVVRRLDAPCGPERSRLLALGFTPGRSLEVVRNAQGPMVLYLGTSRICICRHQARHVLVEVLDQPSDGKKPDASPRHCSDAPTTPADQRCPENGWSGSRS